MPRMPRQQAGPGQKNREIPIIRSPAHATVYADSAVVTVLGDEIGATINVYLTRTENTPTAETQLGSFDQATRAFLPAGLIQTEQALHKSLDATVVMRPDQALKLAVAILTTLSQMPPHARATYRIPDIEAQPVP